MSIYTFETVPGSLAAGYDSAKDELKFSDARATGASSLVIHGPPPFITVLSLSENRPVTFGPGLAGETVTFADSSKLLIGLEGADTLSGGPQGDGLFGGPGADKLSGGAGGDLLGGGIGADVLSGGAGADHFIVNAGDSPPTPGAIDIITDWQFGDALSFGVLANLATPSGRYVESTAADFSAALTFANTQIGSGAADYVAVAVGSDIAVFADSRGDDGTADDAVILAGRGPGDIDATSLIDAKASPPPSALPLPTPTPTPSVEIPVLPPAPQPVGFGASGRMSGDVDHAHLSYLLDAVITDASETEFAASVGDISLRLFGIDFAVDDEGQLAGGEATSISYAYGAAHGGPFSMSLSIPHTPLTTLAVWAVTDAAQTAFASILRGDDNLGGGVGADVLRGYDGSDLLYGAGGSDTIWGGLGNDVIYGQATPTTTAGAAGSTYLRGEEGNDYIFGGVGFDDINGNAGADTLSGDRGDDWVVGGKDNDLQFGSVGEDIVWGNLGNDTLVGGDGNDQVRGGQGDDLVYGGDGGDFVSGDRGADTIAGGAGADLFHGSQDAGIDRVLDFNLAEGDKVMLDPGTTYTLSQSGADTVIDMGGGHQMILVGVHMLTLTPGWIFGA